jgi:hypothetical protein
MMQTCALSGISPHFWAFWAPIIAFESLLCAMALYRGLKTYNVCKVNGTSSIWSLDWKSGMKLVDVLVRDSVVYFLVMFATYLTNAMVWVLGTVRDWVHFR